MAKHAAAVDLPPEADVADVLEALLANQRALAACVEELALALAELVELREVRAPVVVRREVPEQAARDVIDAVR
jgi:hypothetical protein